MVGRRFPRWIFRLDGRGFAARRAGHDKDHREDRGAPRRKQFAHQVGGGGHLHRLQPHEAIAAVAARQDELCARAPHGRDWLGPEALAQPGSVVLGAGGE